jgi:hypothetical protein
MYLKRLMRSWFGQGGRRRKPVRLRPAVEALESRWLPSGITEFALPPQSGGARHHGRP